MFVVMLTAETREERCWQEGTPVLVEDCVLP